jgi:hypothetical protein
MILKRHKDFLKNDLVFESFYEDEIPERKQRAAQILIENDFKRGSDGRFNYDGDFHIDSRLSKDLIYGGYFLVPLGVIKGNFSIDGYGANLTKSLENLPNRVTGNMNLSGCGIKSLKTFHTRVGEDLNLAHNHLHKLENMPKVVDGAFDVTGNMLTTLEGCPEQVESFYAEDNWFNTGYGAPKRITKRQTSGYSGNRNYHAKLGDKVPQIEQDFYSEKSFYNEERKKEHPGITNYWTELMQYAIKRHSDFKTGKLNEEDFENSIKDIQWPEDMEGKKLKTSVTTMNKFNI